MRVAASSLSQNNHSSSEPPTLPQSLRGNSFRARHTQVSSVHEVIEIHDFTIPDDSDDDISESSDDSGGDGYPVLQPSLSTLLQPWPRIYRLVGDSSPVGEAWPRFLTSGVGMAFASKPRRRRRMKPVFTKLRLS
jgi:hypothetical protein